MLKTLYFFKNGILSTLVIALTIATLGASSRDNIKKGTNTVSGTNSNYTILDYNNITMPLNNVGVLSDVYDLTSKFGGYSFLFSGGFFLSGLSGTQHWTNGVMTSSRITDYVPGPVGSSPTDIKNRMYVITAQDPAFGTSWLDWKDAVSVGADFYDGDHDGLYNPVDKNNNGVWDADEDRPDLIGDFTAWCVYNDNLVSSQRVFTDVIPQGIEVRQTVFGFATKGDAGNMLFIRYRLINKGTAADVMDSVYFSAVCDPDLGESGDDLVGCDTIIKAGFDYNNGPDNIYGTKPPCFLVDFIQGPVSYIPGVTFTDINGNGVYDEGIDVALKMAFNIKGNFLGADTIKGAMNVPLTSFTEYMQSHPTHGDPSTQYEARNYMTGGKGKNGAALNVCTWPYGNGSTLTGCAQVYPQYMYSGDPVTGTGWLNTTPIDQRFMCNSGPFKLYKNKPVDIVVAYVVGQGTSAKNSITVAKSLNVRAQRVFDSNITLSFPSDVKVTSGLIDNFNLEQNYPNPFNPATTIKYSVPVTGKVTLIVFDLLGREVAELVNSIKSAGEYEAKFDASKLSSGMYIYSINSGSYSASKKMMLLK